jgi:hypothetical protein
MYFKLIQTYLISLLFFRKILKINTKNKMKTKITDRFLQIILIISTNCLLFLNCNEIIKITTTTTTATSSKITKSDNNDAQVAVLDCSKPYPNIFYDQAKNDWSIHSDKKCFNTEQEILSFCQVVYPHLNIVNIMRMQEPVKFTIFGCKTDKPKETINVKKQAKDKLCSKVDTEYIQPFKCLHGHYRSKVALFIPKQCEFQHLYSNEGCQTQEHWQLLSNEKCKTFKNNQIDGIVNSSMMLQWCDAKKDGISTFTGIEFVCCPKELKTNTKNEQANIDDDDNVDADFSDEEYDEIYNDNDDLLDYQEEFTSLNLKKEQDDDFTNFENMKDEDNDFNKVVKKNGNDLIPPSPSPLSSQPKKAQTNKDEDEDLTSVEGTIEERQRYEKEKKTILTSIKTTFDQVNLNYFL